MGGSRSTRWRGHRKRPLVEEAPCLDLVALRRAGVLTASGGAARLKWTLDGAGEALGRALLSVGPALKRGWGREVAVYVTRPGRRAIVQRLRLLRTDPHFGGTRWWFRCPIEGCGRRALKLYVEPEGDRLGCRRCLNLTHRSAQQHDKRLDQATRDPIGFLEDRASAPTTLRSAMVTQRFYFRGLERKACFPRKGRGCGRRSVTSLSRVLAQLRHDYERRWGRPLPGPPLPSNG